MKPFDVALCDTCIGGSTVIRTLARDRSGLRAFFLADYGVNPLGTKDRDGIRSALDHWIRVGGAQADLVVIACNTASVRLQEVPDIVLMAEAEGVRVVSMVDLLDRALAAEQDRVEGKTVALMGTEFTVGSPIYRRRLEAVGAREVKLLPATRTEALVARLRYLDEGAPAAIEEEVGQVLRGTDTVALACTCFPLISPVLEALAPGIGFLDPGQGIQDFPGLPNREGPNRMVVAVTGDVVSPAEVGARAGELFPGWEVESVAASS